jgi:hypothetical protein
MNIPTVRTILAWGTCLFSALAIAHAETDVQFRLTDPAFGISQTTNRQIVVQAESGTQVNGANVLLPFRLSQYTDTNGVTTFSNLFGSLVGGYYHVTIPAPPQSAQFDIWVSSTNLGLVQASTLIGTFGISSFPAGVFAWGAQISDARYAASTNQAGSFVQIGQLLSTSNAIVEQIPSTNGLASIPLVTTTSNALYADIQATAGSATNAIANDNGSGTNTTLYFLNAAFGTNNRIVYTGNYPYGSLIAGGAGNLIGFSSAWDTISGGGTNLIATAAQFATVSGGVLNTADGWWSSVAGGVNNYIDTGGSSAFIGGGSNNYAGWNGCDAFGINARADNPQTYVWSDGTPFSSTANNQYLVHAAGGFGINTNNPGTNALSVAGNVDAYGFTIKGVPIQATQISVAAGTLVTASTNAGVVTISALSQTNGLVTTNQLASSNFVNLATLQATNAALTNYVLTQTNFQYAFITNLNTVTSNGLTAQIQSTNGFASTNYVLTQTNLQYSFTTNLVSGYIANNAGKGTNITLAGNTTVAQLNNGTVSLLTPLPICSALWLSNNNLFIGNYGAVSNASITVSSNSAGERLNLYLAGVDRFYFDQSGNTYMAGTNGTFLTYNSTTATIALLDGNAHTNLETFPPGAIQDAAPHYGPLASYGKLSASNSITYGTNFILDNSDPVDSDHNPTITVSNSPDAILIVNGNIGVPAENEIQVGSTYLDNDGFHGALISGNYADTPVLSFKGTTNFYSTPNAVKAIVTGVASCGGTYQKLSSTLYTNYFTGSYITNNAANVWNLWQGGSSKFSATGLISSSWTPTGIGTCATQTGIVFDTDGVVFQGNYATNTTQVYYTSGSNPNGSVTAIAPAFWYDQLGGFWVKTNHTYDSSGWRRIAVDNPY